MTARFKVERDDEAVTTCENPHPVRFSRKRPPQHEPGEPHERDQAIRYGAKGYRCPGWRDHFYTVWFVVDTETEEQIGSFDTYRDAVAERDRCEAEESAR